MVVCENKFGLRAGGEGLTILAIDHGSISANNKKKFAAVMSVDIAGEISRKYDDVSYPTLQDLARDAVRKAWRSIGLSTPW